MSIPIYSLKAEEKKFLRAEFVNTPEMQLNPLALQESMTYRNYRFSQIHLIFAQGVQVLLLWACIFK